MKRVSDDGLDGWQWHGRQGAGKHPSHPSVNREQGETLQGLTKRYPAVSRRGGCCLT